MSQFEQLSWRFETESYRAKLPSCETSVAPRLRIVANDRYQRGEAAAAKLREEL
jgi:hypothetical protein